MFGSTKTDKVRVVHVPAFLRDTLAEHLEAYSVASDPEALVFTTAQGLPLRLHNWRTRTFLPARARADVAPIRVHDLRHTAAALAIGAGAHPKMLQEMLGHSSITTTLDRYGHLLPMLHAELADKLDDMHREAQARPSSDAAVVHLR